MKCLVLKLTVFYPETVRLHLILISIIYIGRPQRMLTINSQGELGGMNPVIKRHLELEIKTLQNAPRTDEDKLEAHLRKKKGGKENSTDIEDIQRLVT
jgi:hypothetical protein